MYDYHIHSNYSDGRPLPRMLAAAEDLGLEGVGVADHCVVSSRPEAHRARVRKGFNLDVTHERRSEAIESFRETADVEIYDAVEMDYHPDDEADIAAFLDGTAFDYAIGSVHYLDGVNVHDREYFGAFSESARREYVERYFERLRSLVESGLFDVVAHPDLIERNPALRGFATAEQYGTIASALADHDATPEINAGRANRAYGEFHPAPEFLRELREHGVSITLGSDAHTPGALRERHELIDDFLAEHDIEPARPV